MTAERPTLLVVDDETGVLRLIERFARKQGFDVSSAGSGRVALQRLREERAAVVLVDLRMPDIDGLEVLREIRAIRDGRPQSRHANSSISSALCTSREVGAHHR